jgi:hypothetical protein
LEKSQAEQSFQLLTHAGALPAGMARFKICKVADTSDLIIEEQYLYLLLSNRCTERRQWINRYAPANLEVKPHQKRRKKPADDSATAPQYAMLLAHLSVTHQSAIEVLRARTKRQQFHKQIVKYHTELPSALACTRTTL